MASNMMELMKAKFESMSKEELSLTARKAGDDMMNAFSLHAAEVGDMKLMVAGVMVSRVCIKLGFCTRRLSQKQQWLLKEICPNAIDARKSMAEFVVEPIDDTDYKLIGMFTDEKMPDRQITQSMFDLLMSAAYIDGGLKPEVEKKIDPMFGFLFLGMFFDSGLESVPAPRRKVTGLEARVLDVMLKDGTMMSLKDINKALPGETQSAIKAALGELCDKGLVNYYDSTILGETYGVNVERDEVDIDLSSKKASGTTKKIPEQNKIDNEPKSKEKPLSAEEAEELLKKAEARRIATVEAKEKYEKESRQYEQDVEKWKSDCEEIEAKRTAFVYDKIDKEKQRLVSAATKKRDKAIESADAVVKEQAERKSAAEEKLSSLGMFKFSEKKAQKMIIAETYRLYSDAQASIYAAQSEYSSEMQQVESKANSKGLAYKTEAEKEFPLPAKPRKSYFLSKAEKTERDARKGRKSRTVGMTPAQKKNETLKNAILDDLRYYEPMTAADMIEKIPKLNKESVQHVYTLCRSLLESGKIGKISYKRKTYYIVKE